MYAASQAFIDAMRAQKRRVVARVTIDYTDVFIDQSITVTANDQARISWPNQTADGLTAVPYLWASLDGTWTLDQARRPMPDTPELASRFQVGWWGQQLAGADGSFVAPYPTLTVSHLPRPVHSLRVVGESVRGEYPTQFVIRLKAADGAVLHEETVTGNTQLDWKKTLASPVLNVTTQELEIRAWSHPGRQAKITEFFSSVQQTYEGEGLISLRLLEEREASQGSLPVGNISANELTVTLGNDDGRFDPDNDSSPLYGLIKPNRRIRAWLGADLGSTTEWVPLGVFWSTDWDIVSDTLEATVRALDQLEQLRKTTYSKSVVGQNVTAYSLAGAILQDAGLKSTDYVLDTALQSVTFPWAWMPAVSHREALRILAEATMAVVYCDRDGRIRITIPAATVQQALAAHYLQGGPFPAEVAAPVAYGIGPDDYFAPIQAPARQDQVANEIVVTTQPVKPAPTAQEVYRSTTPITVPAGQTVVVTVQYNKEPVTEATAALENPPAGLTITAASYYAWGAEISITNSSATSADIVLAITGRPLETQAGERIIARDDVSITENGVLRYEFPANHLIQTVAQAQAIAWALLASAKDPRRDIEFEWRGNPALELGDVVQVVTEAARDKRSNYVVIRQELEWAGALSARLTGRRIA